MVCVNKAISQQRYSDATFSHTYEFHEVILV